MGNFPRQNNSRGACNANHHGACCSDLTLRSDLLRLDRGSRHFRSAVHCLWIPVQPRRFHALHLGRHRMGSGQSLAALLFVRICIQRVGLCERTTDRSLRTATRAHDRWMPARWRSDAHRKRPYALAVLHRARSRRGLRNERRVRATVH
jgi:hypothetical protein